MRSNLGITLVVVLACAAAACARKTAENSGSQLTQLSCGGKTYRIGADRIDGEVDEGCRRVKASAEALRTYRATIARFTCQEDNGHIVLSLLAPSSLFDQYDRNCRQYLDLQQAFHAGTMDIAAHREAMKDFTAKNNELARRHGQDDNTLFRQRQADQASLARLVRDRGGSIEITD
jgi:hypothetical protein